MQLPIDNISINVIETETIKKLGISLSVLRLDEIHPQVSGNKLFKLHYFVEQCLATQHKTMLTFGGAYSNHLSATAFYCQSRGIKCIGVVRGEKPSTLSHTLLNCIQWGMLLHFVSRADYTTWKANPYQQNLVEQFGACTIVPEGGFAPAGAAGAAHIMDTINLQRISHIVVSVGTATTLAGLLQNNKNNIKIIAVPAIKNMTDVDSRLSLLNDVEKQPIIWPNYHFGGYAKYTNELLTFMNNLYCTHQIPTDFIYTAKMMYAVMDKIKEGFFSKNDHIMCIHTGGLQGNQSLKPNTLIF